MNNHKMTAFLEIAKHLCKYIRTWPFVHVHMCMLLIPYVESSIGMHAYVFKNCKA